MAGAGRIGYRVLARWQEFANQLVEERLVGEYDTDDACIQAMSDYSHQHKQEIGTSLKGYTIIRFHE